MMHDLVVVGGGPAGATAARAAALAGLHTLLIEQATFPRYKACGGALSERALAHLELQLPDGIIEADILGATIQYAGHANTVTKRGRIAVTVSRDRFDEFLLDQAIAAGVEVKQGVRVRSVTEDGDCVAVASDAGVHSSRYVVIADGAHGQAQRVVRAIDPPSRYGVCLVTEIAREECSSVEFSQSVMRIYFGVARYGYGWIIPHGRYLSVGIGGLASAIKDPKQVMWEFLNDCGFIGAYDIKAHKIPAGGFRRNTCTDRILLVGDAAGFVDSFYGEGLYYAVRSGKFAAQAIATALTGRARDRDVSRRYRSLCSSEFGKDLRYSLILSKLAHSFPGLFLRVLASDREAVERYLDIPAGASSYKSFMTWLGLKLPLLILRNLG